MLRTALSRRAIYPALRVGAQRYPYPQVRLASTTSLSRPFLHRTRLLIRWTGYAAASTVVGVVLITGGIFVHDAFTYTEAHVNKVPVSPLALCVELGRIRSSVPLWQLHIYTLAPWAPLISDPLLESAHGQP